MKRRQFLGGILGTLALNSKTWGQTVYDHVALLLPPGYSRDDSRLVGIISKHNAQQAVVSKPINLYQFDVLRGEVPGFIADAQSLGIMAKLEAITPVPSFSINPNDPSFSSQTYIPQMSINGTGGAWDLLGSYGNSSIIVADLNSGNSTPSGDEPPNLAAAWNILLNGGLGGPSSYPNDADTYTSYGHGTLTESTVYNATNNSNKVAGIANGCTLMPVQSFNDSGTFMYTTESGIAAGMTWAATSGAKIVSAVACNAGASTAISTTAVNLCRANGCLVVSGSNDGNPPGTSSPGFVCSPGDLPTVLCAVPVTSTDTTPSFFGGVPYGDVAIPGNNILGLGQNNATSTASGVSYSIPMLAGVAALVWSGNTSLSAQDVATILMSTCDRVGGQTGWTKFFGVGRVNAARAVKAAQQGFLSNQAIGTGHL